MSAGGAGVVIVGAGHAGGTAAALLRQYGYEGAVTLVGEEPLAPYQRPPLSKAWLKGEADGEGLALRPAAFYPDNGIDFRPRRQAIGLNRSDRTVTLLDGAQVAYDILILATGARAIVPALPGVELPGVMRLRTAADADQIRAAVGPGKTLAVVGGGYIGLEVAASARALGAEVVVLEREARLLARVACPALSDFFRDYHERRGVRFHLGSAVEGFEGRDKVAGVRLAGGAVVACDAVVVGIGAAPNDELAAGAGLATERGVVVDLQARTSDPAIFAIGDVTRRPMPIYGRMVRVESVPNALEQAKQAVSAITGRAPPPCEVPWQWSDQYDLKLQIAGLAFDVDETLVRGDPAAGKFAVFHLKGDRVQAVEAINAPAEFMMGRQLIASRKPVSKAKLADPTVSMKDVAA